MINQRINMIIWIAFQKFEMIFQNGQIWLNHNNSKATTYLKAARIIFLSIVFDFCKKKSIVFVSSKKSNQNCIWFQKKKNKYDKLGLLGSESSVTAETRETKNIKDPILLNILDY